MRTIKQTIKFVLFISINLYIELRTKLIVNIVLWPIMVYEIFWLHFDDFFKNNLIVRYGCLNISVCFCYILNSCFSPGNLYSNIADCRRPGQSGHIEVPRHVYHLPKKKKYFLIYKLGYPSLIHKLNLITKNV